MALVEGIVTLFSVLSVLFFLTYVAALIRQPTGQRPDTPTMNRFGEPLAASPNPGYEETEEQSHG